MLTTATVRGIAPDLTPAPLIMVVEDEPGLADGIQYALQREGWPVVVAYDGQAALDTFRSERPALVLLDLMLPRIPGLDVCRIIRTESNVPILILSAKVSETDRVLGLETGADDYITKPFSMRELISRVRANLRRAGMMGDGTQSDVVICGPIELDSARHEVRVRGEHVELTPKEFKLLETLLHGLGRLRTRSYLIEEVWGTDYYGDTKTLDVHVKRLRQKIELDPHNPEMLVTVRGLGYRFLEEQDPEEALAIGV
jgi:two-component system response regulator RegX3